MVRPPCLHLAPSILPIRGGPVQLPPSPEIDFIQILNPNPPTAGVEQEFTRREKKIYPPLDLYISSVAASPDGDRSAHERDAVSEGRDPRTLKNMAEE